MNNDKINIELLAPAKNLDFGKEAILHGADAVYIGGLGFGARKAVGNSIEDIAVLSEFAHVFGAKVYVTVNTILFDDEFKQVERLIHQLYDAKVDGIIIQDFGILEMNLPPTPIIGSTQMFLNDIEKIKFVRDIGFKRAILPREMLIDDFRKIKENVPGIELEAFVHGALCVSYSGQCYISREAGKRSGNRGDCAQVCRQKFSLLYRTGEVIEQDKYLLSIKDMNRSARLEEMMHAGITSFKIEGRLKDLSYLRNVTYVYHQLINEIIDENPQYQRVSRGRVITDYAHKINDKTDLVKRLNYSFNRGFTEYFLLDKKENIYADKSPKFVGLKVAEVIKTNQDKIIVKTNEQFSPGDGLCYFSNDDEITGFTVNQQTGDTITANKPLEISFGTILYRNIDKAFNDEVLKSNTKRQLLLSVNVVINKNIIEVGYKCSDAKVRLTTKHEYHFEPARNEEGAKQQIIKQFKKTGNPLFFVDDIDVYFNYKIPFFPVKTINEIRRTAFDAFVEEYYRVSNVQDSKELSLNKEHFYYKKELYYNDNISNKYSKQFFENHDARVIEEIPEVTENFEGVDLMTTKMCLRAKNKLCPQNNPKIKKASPLILKNNNKTYSLEFDCKNCVMKVVLDKDV